MLAAWARARLLPRNTEPTPSAPPPEVGPGTVLCSAVTPGSGVPAERFLLRDQFLHKAVLVVLGELPGGAVSACVLNRPTSSTVRFNLSGRPSRRLLFGGDREVRGDGLSAIGGDGSGQLWLHHRAELGGTAVGESGLYALEAAAVSQKLIADETSVSNFLLSAGMVQFERAECAAMLAAGQLRVVPPSESLFDMWPRVWSLATDDGEDVSDGTEAWWEASLICEGGFGGEAPEAPPPSELADEALAEWLRWFAGRLDTHLEPL